MDASYITHIIPPTRRLAVLEVIVNIHLQTNSLRSRDGHPIVLIVDSRQGTYRDLQGLPRWLQGLEQGRATQHNDVAKSGPQHVHDLSHA